MSAQIIGFITGLTAEARIAARCGGLLRAGGGTPAGAERAARQLVAEGAGALVSFGLAGGLDPALRPGALVVPAEVIDAGVIFAADPMLSARFGGMTVHRLFAAEAVVTDAAAKWRAAQANSAQAVDLESGAVARVAAEHGLPFAVVRAICDPAERDLPAAALTALDQKGAIGLIRVLGSLLRQPGQLPNLLGLARDAARAQRTLIEVADAFVVR
jgi:adenosylhomocysteine nucleosidase